MRDSQAPDNEGNGAWSGDDERWASWMGDAQLGDKPAYERLLTEVAATIRHYLLARFGPADFIDDVTQECLLSIHKGRHTYDARRPFRAWMFAIVRHRSVDFLRRRGSDTIANAGRIDPDSQPSTSAEQIESAAEASLILAKLSDEHRDIIVLMKYHGYSAREVGTQLGISVSAVRVRLHRALSRTRRLLDMEDHSPI